MYENIKEFQKHFLDIITKCSYDYKFKQHSNCNKERHIDKLYGNDDLNKDISKVITCKDYIFFHFIRHIQIIQILVLITQ